MFSKAEKRGPILGSFWACLALSFLVVSSTADELYGKMINFGSGTYILTKKDLNYFSYFTKEWFFSRKKVKQLGSFILKYSVRW